MIKIKRVNQRVLRNLLFTISGMAIASLIVSASVSQAINYKIYEKETSVSTNMVRMREELEFNDISDIFKEYADKTGKLFNQFSNVIVTDESGSLVYKLNDGYVSGQNKFNVIVNPNIDNNNFYMQNMAFILSDKNSIQYAVRLFREDNTGRLQELSAANPYAKELFSQTVSEKFGRLTIKNSDGTVYTIANESDIMLSYAYIGSKGYNLYCLFNMQDSRNSITAEYQLFQRLTNFLFSMNGPSLFQILFLFFWLLLPVWIFTDARIREFRAPLWAVLALVTNVVGLIIYLVVRPEYVKCVHCGEHLSKKFVVCPYCGTRNKALCPDCKAVMEEDWVACPYCGHIPGYEQGGTIGDDEVCIEK